MNNDTGNDNRQHTFEPDSIWSNIKYGVVTLIVIVGPLLIPGVTINHWIMGFFAITIALYLVICLLGIWQGLMADKPTRKKTNRK